MARGFVSRTLRSFTALKTCGWYVHFRSSLMSRCVRLAVPLRGGF